MMACLRWLVDEFAADWAGAPRPASLAQTITALRCIEVAGAGGHFVFFSVKSTDGAVRKARLIVAVFARACSRVSRRQVELIRECEHTPEGMPKTVIGMYQDAYWRWPIRP